jgi:hypothetical protein
LALSLYDFTSWIRPSNVQFVNGYQVLLKNVY